MMEGERFDALIAYASRIQYGMVRYLTGYEPWVAPEEWAFAVFTPGFGTEISLLSNSPWDFWEFNRAESTWVSDVVVGNQWVKSLTERLPASLRRVGIAGWHGFPTPVYLGLKEQFPHVRFEDASGLLRELRAVKSKAEIALLREASTIADKGGQAFFEAALPGVSEREVSSRIDAAMMRNGADRFGYFTILGSGPKTVASCFYPTQHVLEAGEIVQLDCAPMMEGYKADFSRLMIPGQGLGRALRLVETVAEMFERCAERLRPGVTCLEIAQAGLEAALANGYTRENLFVSANYPGVVMMGHGIGLDNPDPPGMISTGNPAVLQENMVINLEPILVDPGIGGGRIEGAFVVTPQGPVSLSSCEIRPWRVPQAKANEE